MFKAVSWSPLYHFFEMFFQKLSIFGPPSKFDGVPKLAPKSTKCRQKFENVRCRDGLFRVFVQTLLSRNHSNPCAAGTSWLLKGTFSMEIGKLYVFVVFICVLFCMTLHRTVTVRITRAYAVVSGPTCTSPLIEEEAQLWQYRVPVERPA